MTTVEDRYLWLANRLDRADIDWTGEVDGATFDTAIVAMAKLAGAMVPGAVLDATGDHWLDGILRK